jgi:hypothetical protein
MIYLKIGNSQLLNWSGMDRLSLWLWLGFKCIVHSGVYFTIARLIIILIVQIYRAYTYPHTLLLLNNSFHLKTQTHTKGMQLKVFTAIPSLIPFLFCIILKMLQTFQQSYNPASH